MVDLTLALSYFDLLAPAMGLGTCWAGLLQGALLHLPSLKRLPEYRAKPHHYPIMLGYPDAKYYRVPERKAESTFRVEFEGRATEISCGSLSNYVVPAYSGAARITLSAFSPASRSWRG